MPRFASQLRWQPPLPSPGAAERLAEQVAAMAPVDGIAQTLIPELIVYRQSQPAAGIHAVYRPSLCVVVQGGKRAHFGARAIEYDAERFFFTAVPMAADIDVFGASAEAPLLGLVLEMKLEQIARVALDIDAAAPEPAPVRAAPSALPRADERSGFVGPLEPELREALTKLLLCGADPLRFRVLYPHVLHEIIFLLLTGDPGRRLRATLGRGLSVQGVVESARYIDRHFGEKLTVRGLARRAGMSVSAYHDQFRRVTSLSPIQYVKRIRLQQSRVMLSSGRSVTEAAFAVGYASTSQFSRDFKSFFALSPSQARRSAA